jgi:hypothetical protein
MRATIDGPATGRSTAIWGACDAAVQHRPRRAGRDPTIPEETSIARAPKPARTARNRPAPYGTVQDSTGQYGRRRRSRRPRRRRFANPIPAAAPFHFPSFSVSESS